MAEEVSAVEEDSSMAVASAAEEEASSSIKCHTNNPP